MRFSKSTSQAKVRPTIQVVRQAARRARRPAPRATRRASSSPFFADSTSASVKPCVSARSSSSRIARLDALAVLRRVDRRHAEAADGVQRARAEVAVGAVGKAFLLAHARGQARRWRCRRAGSCRAPAPGNRDGRRAAQVQPAAQHRIRLVRRRAGLARSARARSSATGCARTAPGFFQSPNSSSTSLRQRVGIEIADRDELRAGCADQVARSSASRPRA